MMTATFVGGVSNNYHNCTGYADAMSSMSSACPDQDLFRLAWERLGAT